jgi:hypothetical protein
VERDPAVEREIGDECDDGGQAAGHEPGGDRNQHGGAADRGSAEIDERRFGRGRHDVEGRPQRWGNRQAFGRGRVSGGVGLSVGVFWCHSTFYGDAPPALPSIKQARQSE